MKTKGIFCLEGDWWNDLNRSSSVKPILDLVSHGGGPRVPYVHRGVGTTEELDHYLGIWLMKRYAAFPILYLAFHGDPGVIHLANGSASAPRINLDWLEARLAGRCTGRLIHFASCATLKTDMRRWKRFLRTTGAIAVTGYLNYVDWLQSAAMDLLLFDAMQRNAFTAAGANAIHARLRRDMSQLLRTTGFRMVVRG